MPNRKNKLEQDSGMVQDLETGRFETKLTKKLRDIMKTKNVVAMATDSRGHYCWFRGAKRKVTEQKERFATFEEALKAVK